MAVVETLLHEVRRLQSQVQSIGDGTSLDILQRNTVSADRLYERILKERDSAGEAAPPWETSCKSFVEVVCILHDTMDVLFDRVKQTTLRNDELAKNFAEVTQTLEELQRKHAMLEEIEQKLVVGQITFEIHELVLDVVLKGIGSREDLAIFTIGTMEKANQISCFEVNFNIHIPCSHPFHPLVVNKIFQVQVKHGTFCIKVSPLAVIKYINQLVYWCNLL